MTLSWGPSELAELSEKYDLLLALRRARERGEPIPDRRVFRELASRFPGALRELDRMPMATLERRAAELAEVRAGQAPRPWMAVVASYHELIRFALAHRGRHAASPPTGGDREFLEGLARPPSGRVVPLVTSRLARVLGCEVADVIALLER